MFFKQNPLMKALTFQPNPLAKGLSFQPSANFATSNLKTLKIRMKAVGSIKKITKAMRMVAAAKMRSDVNRLEQGKKFGVGTLQKLFDNESYLQKRKPQVSVKKTLLVPITSDKGLCGSVNAVVVREIKAIVKPDRSAFKLFIVGEKGQMALIRPFPDLIKNAVTQVFTPINFPVASSIAHMASQQAEDCDNIVIVYNEFQNVITQVVRRMEMMTRKNFLKQFKYVVRYDAAEPEKEYAQHHFYDFYLASAMYHAMLNNTASETSSRMNAMENASKNAGEILDKLTLDYNKARQAKITLELCEIISGAAAVWAEGFIILWRSRDIALCGIDVEIVDAEGMDSEGYSLHRVGVSECRKREVLEGNIRFRVIGYFIIDIYKVKENI